MAWISSCSWLLNILSMKSSRCEHESAPLVLISGPGLGSSHPVSRPLVLSGSGLVHSCFYIFTVLSVLDLHTFNNLLRVWSICLFQNSNHLFHTQIFNKTSMKELRNKSIMLTGYLEYLIQHYYVQDPAQPHKPHVHIITPSDPRQRGCQLSLSFSIPIRKVFQELERRGVAVSSSDVKRCSELQSSMVTEVLFSWKPEKESMLKKTGQGTGSTGHR